MITKLVALLSLISLTLAKDITIDGEVYSVNCEPPFDDEYPCD